MSALRAAGPGRVAVELDGERWRTLPLEAVVKAGLAVGAPLGRAQARTLARERRRLGALRVATQTLRRRARSAAELERRLDDRGVGLADRRRTLATLESAGLVDDVRFARARAEALAARASGDALIRDDLGRRGVGPDAIEAALEGLVPERDRAAAVVARRGTTAATARYLAARGFDADTVADAVARDGAEPLE